MPVKHRDSPDALFPQGEGNIPAGFFIFFQGSGIVGPMLKEGALSESGNPFQQLCFPVCQADIKFRCP